MRDRRHRRRPASPVKHRLRIGSRSIAQVAAHVIEDLARQLAGESGVAWSGLSNHPGYHKSLWREKAAAILAAAGIHVAGEIEPEFRPIEPRFMA